MAKIVFFGTPDYVLCIPQVLLAVGHKIAAVVTPAPRPSGRKQVLETSPVEVWAKEKDVPVIYNLEEVQSIKADVGVVASYGRIIPDKVLEHFPKGLLNVHPSLLPKYRGASPIPAAIFVGDKETGVTIIKMDNKMDHGPILIQEKLPIGENDTTEDLLKVAFAKGAQMLVEILPDYLVGKAKLTPQDDSKTSFTWKTNETKQKAYFDINNPLSPEAIDRMARAFYPWPNAWTTWKDKIVKFYPNKMIQLEGKNKVTYKQFKEGYPDFPLPLTSN